MIPKSGKPVFGEDHAQANAAMITRFVTATGTGLGKTLVTAALCHQLRAQGRSVRAIKPVLTGLAGTAFVESDAGILLRSLGKRPSFETAASRPPQDEHLQKWELHPEERPKDASRRMGQDLDAISPFRFAAPLAPSMAAAREGRALDVDAVLGFCRTAMAGPEEVLLIEGIGGVMVPLAPGVTVLDWIKALGVPAILVTGSYLGSLSHALTALKVLRLAGVPLKGLIISESEESIGLAETAAELRLWTDAPVVALPRVAGADPWRRAPDLTGRL